MFQSAPPSRAATGLARHFTLAGQFQSAPPSRAATWWTTLSSVSRLFQSAPPSRAATDCDVVCHAREDVSIRAALTGGDRWAGLRGGSRGCFNPRRPHGRRQEEDDDFVLFFDVSIRAALTGGDTLEYSGSGLFSGFNPRRPHGRRPLTATRKVGRSVFQSAPPSRGPEGVWMLSFQSAPPSRAATAPAKPARTTEEVSIRAALTGGDLLFFLVVFCSCGFNPRRPHGRRLTALLETVAQSMFQSAPPSRAATDTFLAFAGI